MPRLRDPAELRSRVAAAPVARLATLRPDGAPRLVPISFVLVDELLCSAVDQVKSKDHPRLARLSDIAHDSRVSVLIDHYTPDWSQLWWIRIDGTAVVHDAGELWERALAALTVKYPQYADQPPNGPVIAVTPSRWSGWVAAR